MHHYASGHLQVGRSAPAARMFLFFCVAAVAARKAQLSTRGITLQPHVGTTATAKRHEYRQPAWLSCCRCITRADVSATVLFAKQNVLVACTQVPCMPPVHPAHISISFPGPARQLQFKQSKGSGSGISALRTPRLLLYMLATCTAASQLQLRQTWAQASQGKQSCL